MSTKKSICVDLDGVLAQYDGWKGLDHIGDPIPGAKEFLTRLQEKYRVMIFTTRCNVERNSDDIPSYLRDGEDRDEPFNYQHACAEWLADQVRDWLKEHDLPFDEVYAEQGKPLAVAIIDDRSVACQPQKDEKAYQKALAEISWLDGMHDFRSDKEKLEEGWRDSDGVLRDFCEHGAGAARHPGCFNLDNTLRSFPLQAQEQLNDMRLHRPIRERMRLEELFSKMTLERATYLRQVIGSDLSDAVVYDWPDKLKEVAKTCAEILQPEGLGRVAKL